MSEPKKEKTQVSQDLNAKVTLVNGIGKNGREYHALRIEFEQEPKLNKMVFIDSVQALVYDLHVK